MLDNNTPPSLLLVKQLQEKVEILKTELEATECEVDRQLRACIDAKVEQQGNLRLKHTFTSKRVIVVEKFKKLFPETYKELKQNRAIQLRQELDFLIEQDLPKIPIKTGDELIGRLRLDPACVHKVKNKYQIVEVGEKE